MDTRDTIIEAACDAVAQDGLDSLTVARVGVRARVSTALVHYHFRTKRNLVAAACERLAARRLETRRAAVAGRGGLAALDALWAALSRGARRGGAERAWHDLVVTGRSDPAVAALLREARHEERKVLAEALPSLLASLGVQPPVAPDDETAAMVQCFLDGASLAVAAGADEAREVRAAYDAFWLAIVTAAQASGR